MKFSAAITIAVIAVIVRLATVDVNLARIRRAIVKRRSPNPNLIPSQESEATSNSVTANKAQQIDRKGNQVENYGYHAALKTTNYVHIGG
jgi:hypothetical protein